MRGSEKPFVSAVAAIITVVGGIALGGCREQKAPQASLVASVSEPGDACAGDTLRPAAGAPAEGLWLFEDPSSVERVAARIGPPQADDKALVVTRPVETVEVSAAGDTIRHRLDAATVSLELLPPLGSGTPGKEGMADSTVSTHPAATYAPSPRVRLAAYEPCATSSRGPRIRYLRRDVAGRIVTDVMLHRASEQ
jgi:hypothetical protein